MRGREGGRERERERAARSSPDDRERPAGEPFVLADSYLAIVGGALVILGTDLYFRSKRKVIKELFGV